MITKRWFSLLLVVLTACGHPQTTDSAADDTAPEATAGGETADTPTGEGANAEAGASGEEVLTVIDAGAEPRRALRYALPEGATSRLHMTQEVATTMRVGGRVLGSPTSFPIVSDMTLGPARQGREGVFVVPFVIDSFALGRSDAIPEAARARMAALLRSMEGIRGQSEISAQGQTLSSTLELPPDLPPNLRDMMNGMREAFVKAAVPFPTEAVGVGARWRTQKHVVQNGIAMDVSASYTLTALDEDGGTFDAQVSGSAPRQELPVGADGTRSELTSMVVRGESHARFHLQSLATELRSWTEVDLDAQIHGADGVVEMHNHTRQTFELGPAPAEETPPAPGPDAS